MEVRQSEDEEVECSDLLLQLLDVGYGGKGNHVLSGQERDRELSVGERKRGEGERYLPGSL